MTYRSRKRVFLGMRNVLVCLLPVASGYQSDQKIRKSRPKTSSGCWLPKYGRTNISFWWVSERTAHPQSEPLQPSVGRVFEEIEEGEGISKGNVICIDQTAIFLRTKGLNSLKIIGPIEQKNLHLSDPLRKHIPSALSSPYVQVSHWGRDTALAPLFFFLIIHLLSPQGRRTPPRPHLSAAGSTCSA